MKRMEKLAQAHLSPVSKPRQINYISTVNTPILYNYVFRQYFPPHVVFFFFENLPTYINDFRQNIIDSQENLISNV